MRSSGPVPRALTLAAALALALAGERASADVRNQTLRVSATVVRSVEVSAGAGGAVAVRRPDGARLTLPLEEAARVTGISVAPADASVPPGFVVVTILADAPLAPRS